MVLGKLDSYTEKDEIRTLPNTVHKNKLRDFQVVQWLRLHAPNTGGSGSILVRELDHTF